MATVILLRHMKSSANGAGVLAGRTPGVELAERGHEQALDLVGRLEGVPITEVCSSPLLRCKQTIAPLLKARGLRSRTDKRLSEVDYGDWTGEELKKLGKEPLWRVVQTHPSAAVFPGGEGLAAMQARAVAAIREHDARIGEQYGAEAVWLACSHGDVIKSVLADALGMHLDSFQRIVVDPGSVSVVRFTETRPFVVRSNDLGGDLSGIVAPKSAKSKRKRGSSDAVVGGSTGN
ncbi:histidine phosphatase family protein [Sciscionella marina]|uniref:histidine phosphatase family protein n=1 Tax=Sciscionella marina TaxID=508770 RepID=UPI0003666745|nr:histidine phosphatase family protein [Sciscionella marina]